MPFISRFKNHSNKIDLKKKDFSNTPLRVVKRQHPNTIQILRIVKKPRAPQYSSAQLRSYKNTVPHNRQTYPKFQNQCKKHF